MDGFSSEVMTAIKKTQKVYRIYDTDITGKKRKKTEKKRENLPLLRENRNVLLDLQTLRVFNMPGLHV